MLQSLSFADFKSDYLRENLPQARRLAIFANILYVLFSLLDGYLIGDLFHEMVLMRIILSGLMALLIIASYFEFFKKYWQSLFAVFIFLAGVGVMILASYLDEPIKTLFLQGLLLIIYYGYTMNRLLLLPATCTGVGITLVYFILYFSEFHFSNIFIITSLFFQVTANLFGIFNAYWRQNLLFNDYLLLEKDKQLKEKINTQNKELVSLNKKLGELASTDGLTGLSNRRYLDKTLKQYARNCAIEHTHLSLIMLDVDYFKNYNDKYGHLKGDACLKEIAHIIGRVIYKATGFAARYGGEEFCIAVTNVNFFNARKIAENIQSLLEQKQIAHSNSPLSKYVTISIGIVSVEKDFQHIHAKKLIKYADTCLYKAKENGRNQISGIVI